MKSVKVLCVLPSTLLDFPLAAAAAARTRTCTRTRTRRAAPQQGIASLVRRDDIVSI